MDNQKPGTTKARAHLVESLDLPLALRRCPCADIASGPRGRHRPQPARAGAPRPIPDVHIQDCRLALGTKHKALQHHCLSIDGKGGWDRQNV